MDLILHIHSIWRWVVLLAALAVVVLGALGLSGQRPWEPPASTLARIFPVILDIQIAIGIILWVGGQHWNDNFFFKILHPLLGLLALGVAHMVSARIKRITDDRSRFQLMTIGYLIALLIVLATIPTAARFTFAG